MKYNQDAFRVISNGIMDMDHNTVYSAINIATQPLRQYLEVVERYPNGIAKLRTVDDTGSICMEWHDVLVATCTCGETMDTYSTNGLRYVICSTCANKIPDDNDIFSFLTNEGK